MRGKVSREQAKKLLGKSIYAVKRDGAVVTGRLIRISGNRLYLSSGKSSKGKKVRTKAFLLPLVLFDLLAIGTLGFWGGGWGGGYGGGWGGGCGCGVPSCGGGCGYGGYGGKGGGYGFGGF